MLPGFKEPPPGYGEVAFYWWLGDPLTRERLAWQLDQLAGKGVMGLQINYAHSDRGGRSFGLTYPSDPPLFSEDWWKLVGWFMQEAKQRGMAVSLSDYTLGIGQGWCVDEVLKENPDLAGSVLRSQEKIVEGGRVAWKLPAEVLMVGAYDPATGAAVDLRARVAGGVLNWQAPQDKHRVAVVYAQRVQPSLDPMNPKSGPEYARKFFGQFEERNPGEGGRGLNFFFSDELSFGVGGNLWTARFAEEFRKRKGYDIVPELPALFADIGPRTPKVRLDYHDVMVSLTEEGFFQPVFAWHQRRGMIYGCDHGGRGRNVVEFGDYFRTQRWNQGPGCDQPRLGRDLIKNKVASSIAHLYLRPRTWLEGFHSSGWGTSSAALSDATLANFAQGQNLLTLHGLYYSTHGGWWEWAPPCNHFRMPYWKHMGVFLKCAQRLSYLLSQGHHRCDVAIMYPVAPLEAGLGGNEAVSAAFAAGGQLYAQGIDFDFLDFESLARAKVEQQQLRVSGARVARVPHTVEVQAGAVPLLVRYDKVGRGFVVLSVNQPPSQPSRLAMTWHDNPAILRFDSRPQAAHPAGWYRFTSPPGLRAMTIIARGKVRAWADGKELAAAEGHRFLVTQPSAAPVQVAVRVAQERGCYGGAALSEPITLDCGPGRIEAGDWSRIDGLASYSGGAWYRKTVALRADQIAGATTLDLGGVVASAEVHVNGRPAGVRVAPPWTFDISSLVRPGDNRIEVLVYNTLANHYSTIPTRYRGSPVSGLLGPVRLEVAR